ncbi:MAG TPA: hypothetical protein VGH32_10550 [Pirellulales bacterium]
MFVLVPICVALIAPTALAGDAQRLAPPTKEARAAAEKIVNELLGAQIDGANRGSAEAKLTLAKTLLKQASETNDNAAARFVMYQKARDLAAAAGDVTIAMSAIDKLAADYEIDAPSERFTTITTLAKNIHSPDAGQAALDAALSAIDEAILADDFEVAHKLVRLATGFAARLHNGPIAAQLKSRPAEIEQLKKEFAKASEAQAKLKNEPDDPGANLTVGYFQGPMKGDFPRGLPFLAKCSDAALADLAKNELAGSADPAEHAKLADGWWDAAEHQREPAKSHTRAHAVALYEKSLPHLKGLTKAEAESRIKQFEADHPTAVGLSRTAIVKVLADGAWRIKWFVSTSDYSGPVASEYPAFVFGVDGSCSHAKLKWRFMDNSATVEIADLSSAYPFLQRFTLVGDTLRCENFNPPGKLLNLGLGTKNPR